METVNRQETTALRDYQRDAIRQAVEACEYDANTIGFAKAIVQGCENAFSFYRFRSAFKEALEVAAFRIISLPRFVETKPNLEPDMVASVTSDRFEIALAAAHVLRPIIEGLK